MKKHPVKKKKKKKKTGMKSVGHVEKLTKAKSFFGDMKRSCCLTFFKASISLGSRRGRSRTLGGTSLELLDGRVPGYSRAIQLQQGVPSWMAHISRVLGLLTLDQRGPSLALGRLLLLGLLLREQLPPPPPWPTPYPSSSSLGW